MFDRHMSDSAILLNQFEENHSIFTEVTLIVSCALSKPAKPPREVPPDFPTESLKMIGLNTLNTRLNTLNIPSEYPEYPARTPPK